MRTATSTVPPNTRRGAAGAAACRCAAAPGPRRRGTGRCAHPPLTSSSAPAGGRGSSRSASQPSGRATGRGGAGPAARGAEDGDRVGLVGDAGQQAGQLVEAAHHRQRPADVGADREALEVPGDVLAEVGAAVQLALLLGRAARRAGA